MFDTVPNALYFQVVQLSRRQTKENTIFPF